MRSFAVFVGIQVTNYQSRATLVLLLEIYPRFNDFLVSGLGSVSTIYGWVTSELAASAEVVFVVRNAGEVQKDWN